jgi:hypothetical protein
MRLIFPRSTLELNDRDAPHVLLGATGLPRAR